MKLTGKSRTSLPKAVAAAGIAVLAFVLALSTRLVTPIAGAMNLTNNLFYDIFYRVRPFEDRKTGPVVIVVADQKSLDSIDAHFHYGWPWPREIWGKVATYVSSAGAKAVGFDIAFSETSAYEKRTGDDELFATAIAAMKCPVVFGSYVRPDGKFDHFAPPINRPKLAAVNVGDGKVYRTYAPVVVGEDSLASSLVKAAGVTATPTRQRFLLHYFGSTEQNTFKYVSADDVLEAQISPSRAARHGVISKDLFKDKIVLFGVNFFGGYDLKSSPLSPKAYPGVEVQATAVENLMFGQSVVPVADAWLVAVPLLGAAVAAFGVIYPRKASLKLLFPAAATIVLLAVGILLFRKADIRWLPPGESLLALAFATPMAFSYTYLAEDRQRRFMLRALSKIVSPAIAEQLSKNPERLALGTVRTQITVVFTDLANFTGLSELMDVQTLGQLLNRYLGEMSDQVLVNNGTLDKYIGDAVMCFWNAPLPQDDHAVLACRAALAMAAAEDRIRAELGAIGKSLFTRIGINTTSAAVGFIGSSHLFNYTALGDGVNLASRLEGANKLYGTRILLSEDTAALVGSKFNLRKIDSLQVKGKTRPIAVFQLISEKTANDHASAKLIRLYESALSAYQKQQWDEADQFLLELATTFGEDPASRVLSKRIAAFRVSPPPAGWDGTFEAREK